MKTQTNHEVLNKTQKEIQRRRVLIEAKTIFGNIPAAKKKTAQMFPKLSRLAIRGTDFRVRVWPAGGGKHW